MQDQIKNKKPRNTQNILLSFFGAFFFALNILTVVLYCLGYKSNLGFFGIIVLSMIPYFSYVAIIKDRSAAENEISPVDEYHRPNFLERLITRVITSEEKFNWLKNFGHALSQLIFFAGVALSIWMNTPLFFWWGCILAWLISYPLIRGYVYRQLRKKKIIDE